MEAPVPTASPEEFMFSLTEEASKHKLEAEPAYTVNEAKHFNLQDPEVWIADSAATVHSTPYQLGMTNVRDTDANDTITVGNGVKGQSRLNFLRTACILQ